MKRVFQSIADFFCCISAIAYVIATANEYFVVAFTLCLVTLAYRGFLLKHTSNEYRVYDMALSRRLDIMFLAPFAETFTFFHFAILFMLFCEIRWTNFITVVPANEIMNTIHKILYLVSILLIFVDILNPTPVMNCIVSASVWVCVLFDFHTVADMSRRFKALKNQE